MNSDDYGSTRNEVPIVRIIAKISIKFNGFIFFTLNEINRLLIYRLTTYRLSIKLMLKFLYQSVNTNFPNSAKVEKFIKQSSPVGVSVVNSLDALESRLPMLVSQGVSDCIHFDSCTKQVSIKAVCSQVSQWNQQNKSRKPHPFSDFLVRVGPTTSSVHEDDEVGNVVGHLWG